MLAGRLLLIGALAIALFGVVASIFGAVSGRREWVDHGRRAVYALTATVAICFGILEIAFLSSDFSFELVGTHSSTTTPAFYQATAPWSSQEGSLLLWVMLLSGWSSLILFVTRRRAREIVPWAAAVLLGLAGFFLALMIFLESPFAAADPAPAEGVGLNPILRHPAMMIHPPMLYSGYTLFTIPFAFAVGALISRRLDADWTRTVRPFALAAWLCLGTGVILGARWSYSELGWGGYWAWDGVENAALMPWLVGTAFLHSVMIQERRGMLKVWNVSLILATGILAVLGTFLVRSGILESIHAFGASTLGIPFLVLIVIMIAGSIALVVSRAPYLRSEHKLDSLLSREAVFLLNNLVLVGLAFVIFWGTFFPLISEAVTGREASVGPPWFGRFVVPLALVLTLLSGLGPLMAWRRVSPAALKRALAWPAGAAAATLAALLATGQASGQPLATIMFALAAFVVAVVVQEFHRGVTARRAVSDESPPRALWTLVRRNHRRFGGYIVHVGIAVLFVGIAASTAFRDVQDVTLAPGESAALGDYELVYERPTGELDITSAGSLEKLNLGADVSISRDGGEQIQLSPARSYFPSSDPSAGPLSRYFVGESTSEVGLQASFRRDYWTVVAPDTTRLEAIARRGDEVFVKAESLPAEERAAALGEALRRMVARYAGETSPVTFRVLISPLVTWIWVGALIVLVGGLVSLWPAPSGVRRRVSAPNGDLEAAKEAKLREIREAELDRRQGKLSDEDWGEIDATLRGEAIELIAELDETRSKAGAGKEG